MSVLMPRLKNYSASNGEAFKAEMAGEEGWTGTFYKCVPDPLNYRI